LGVQGLEVPKSAQYRSLQEFEVRDRGAELLEAPLPVGNLGAEQVLMAAIERFAFQVFVGSIPNGHSGARQDILYPSIQARLFILCRAKGGFNCGDNRTDSRPVGFSISVG
jgi:hypothetical protein